MRIDRRTLLASALAAPLLPTLASAQDGTETPIPAWVLLSAGQENAPVGRWGHSLIVDTWNNRLLLIGGRDAKGTVRGDLWAFDLANWAWSDVDVSGPKARSGSAAAVAPDGSGFYYFGGESNDTVFDELWWFDFATTSWRLLDVPGPGPAARHGTRGVIDALGRFVISHGANGAERFDDTWAYDPSAHTWTEISPTEGERPMARYDHDLVSLPDYGILLLYGGCSEPAGPCPQGDLWSFDLYNGYWAEVTPVEGPSARTGAAMARQGNTVMLVGGDAELGLKSDVWTGDLFDGYFSWSEYTPVNHGPLGIYRRAWHDMAASNGEYYVFGGKGVEGALSDLWKFNPDRIQHPGEDSEYIQPDDVEYGE